MGLSMDAVNAIESPKSVRAVKEGGASSVQA